MRAGDKVGYFVEDRPASFVIPLNHEHVTRFGQCRPVEGFWGPSKSIRSKQTTKRPDKNRPAI